MTENELGVLVYDSLRVARSEIPSEQGLATLDYLLVCILGIKIQPPCVRRCIRADDVLVIPNHMPHSLGLVEKAYARMRSKDPTQKSRAAPTHADDEHRVVDSFPYVACSEAQVPEHDWVPPASLSGNWSALKERIAN